MISIRLSTLSEVSFIVHSASAACESFFSRERIFTHVSASSKVCKEYYRTYGVPVSEDRLKALDQESEKDTKKLKAGGRRRTFAAGNPPVRVSGPLNRWAIDLGVRHDCLLVKPPNKAHRGERRAEERREA